MPAEDDEVWVTLGAVEDHARRCPGARDLCDRILVSMGFRCDCGESWKIPFEALQAAKLNGSLDRRTFVRDFTSSCHFRRQWVNGILPRTIWERILED